MLIALIDVEGDMRLLFPFQQDGVDFLVNRRGVEKRAMLLDECGLGKTIQACCAVRVLADRVDKRIKVLVIAPKIVNPQWEDELSKWNVGAMYDGDNRKMFDFKVIPYSVVGDVGKKGEFGEKLLGILCAKWDVVIVDEFHNFKNWGAKRTEGLVAVLRENKNSFVWMLSATPCSLRAADLHLPLSVMEPGKWGRFGEFCEKFCLKVENKWSPSGYEFRGFNFPEAEELKIALERVGLRREKREVLPELPAVLVSNVHGGIDKRYKYKASERNICLYLNTGAWEDDGNEGDDAREKIRAVSEFLENLEPPFVVFFWHRAMGRALEEFFFKAGKSYGIILGGEDNAETAKGFNAGEFDVCLVSISAGGVGINLQRASRAVFMEYPWTPHLYEQSVGRLDRIGQKNSVNIYQMIVKGTPDERVLKVLDERREGVFKLLKTGSE